MGGQFLFTVVLLFIAQYDVCNGGKFGPGGPFGAGALGGAAVGGPGAGVTGTNQVRFQIIVAQTQAKTAIETANTTILNNIAAAQQSIDADVKAAQDKEATAVGSTTCVQSHSAAIAQIDSATIGPKCDQSTQLLALQGQVTLIAGLHAELSQVYIVCPFWPMGDRATCVDNFAAGITLKLDGLLTTVLDGSNTATSDSAKCVAGEVANDQNIIAQANQALDQCVTAN